jgi:protein regulator of cytokinesis 1
MRSTRPNAIANMAQLFSALSETLHTQLKAVTNEKHEMTEEAQRLVKTIKQMEASLEDNKQNPNYDDHDSTPITYPLTRCLQGLKEKYSAVSKMHRERFEQVRKLAEALDSYASHLEASFVEIKLPPTAPNAAVSPSFDISPSYVERLDNEFTRVYEEYTRRINTVKILCQDIIQLWAELGTPQAQTDSAIVKCHRDAPEQLGLHKDDLAQLKAKKERLVEEKRGRERRLGQLRDTIEELWERLGVEAHERKQFLNSNRGCGMRTINEYEDELARLNELKRQNLHLFVEEARCKLQELWDALYFSEEEMLDFTPAFSEVCSDALLSAHEAEIARLEALKDQRLPILQKIDRHRELIKERNDLAQSSQDASRLMARGQKGEKRDPGKLLREEKMRKRITKELPKIEQVRVSVCKERQSIDRDVGFEDDTRGIRRRVQPTVPRPWRAIP